MFDLVFTFDQKVFRIQRITRIKWKIILWCVTKSSSISFRVSFHSTVLLLYTTVPLSLPLILLFCTLIHFHQLKFHNKTVFRQTVATLTLLKANNTLKTQCTSFVTQMFCIHKKAQVLLHFKKLHISYKKNVAVFFNFFECLDKCITYSD